MYKSRIISYIYVCVCDLSTSIYIYIYIYITQFVNTYIYNLIKNIYTINLYTYVCLYECICV